MEKLNIINNRFGDLIVIKQNLEKSNNKKVFFDCQCIICNRIITKRKDIIIQGKGIYHKDCRYQLKNVSNKFYNAWRNMRMRTTNPNATEYENYEGRGINSDTFKYFIDFYDTMYKSYLAHVELYGENNTTLDRIDSNGNYEQQNIKWATIKEQNQNLTFSLRVKAINKINSNDIIIFESLNDCAKYFNMHLQSIKNRAYNPNKKFKKELNYNFEIIKKY